MENKKKATTYRALKYPKVQALMRYVNKDTLKVMYKRQPKNKAVGIDATTKEKYDENLDENLDKLIHDMKQFSYRPLPVRKTYIPKGNGKMRCLGIPSLEDKMVQGVFKEILEAIYETKFLNCSYGFRPNRSCHDAILKVNKHIIADKHFIRYIKRFLFGGVQEDGKRLENACYRNKIGLIYVNAAYTSIIGESKYSKRMKLNRHQAASYVIARKGQGYIDKLMKKNPIKQVIRPGDVITLI